MLVKPSTRQGGANRVPMLTIQWIAAHLGVQDWTVRRALTRGELTGRKRRGRGNRGQGGQWEVAMPDYLDWLGVPDEDRTQLAPAELPELWVFDDVASQEGLTRDQLLRITVNHALAHLQVGQRRYLTRSQLSALHGTLDALPGRSNPVARTTAGVPVVAFRSALR